MRLSSKMHNVGHIKHAKHAVNVVLVSQIALHKNIAHVAANVLGHVVYIRAIIQRIRIHNADVLVLFPQRIYEMRPDESRATRHQNRCCLGIINSGLTIVEAGIALSVLVLGIAIAAERNLPLGLAMASVGFFGIFHGYAHGTEMPSVAEPIRYAAGFLTGTALLHILGIIIGDISQHYARGKVLLRLAGAAIASIGTWFLVTTT